MKTCNVCYEPTFDRRVVIGLKDYSLPCCWWHRGFFRLAGGMPGRPGRIEWFSESAPFETV